MQRQPLLTTFSFLAIAAMAIMPINSASATPKAGAACTKVGQSSIASGKKFTCVKSGKKLVWDKGVKVISSTTRAAQPIATPSPSITPLPTVPEVVYFAQFRECTGTTNGHEGWVLGKNNTQSQYTFLRCTASHKEDGTPIDVWQIPEDPAKIDQETLKPIPGTGFIPKNYSTYVVHPDWYTFTESSHAKAPNSFDDLYENRRGISYSAWSKLVTAVKSSDSSRPSIEIIIGPNTTPYSNAAKSTMGVVQKFLSVNDGLKRVRVYYYNRTDQPWAASEIEKAIGANEMALAQKNLGGPLAQCYGTTNCNNSGAWTTADGTGYIFMGVPTSPDHRNLAATGEPGEYFHAAWRYFFAKNNSLQAGPAPSIFPANQPPFWLNIGYEEISSNFVESDSSFRRYKELSLGRTQAITQVVPQFNAAWMDEYLNISNLGKRWSDAHSGEPNNQAMVIGPRISEIFIALKGPQVILDLYDRMSRGDSFQKSFTDIFGTPWDVASQEISRVLVDEFESDY